MAEVVKCATREAYGKCGFVCGAAAAFVGEHSFSTVLGGGRPDRKDLECADRFAEEAAEVIRGGIFGRLEIPGRFPYSFYRATDNDGNGIDIRKAKPVTDPELCNGCGIVLQMALRSCLALQGGFGATGSRPGRDLRGDKSCIRVILAR